MCIESILLKSGMGKTAIYWILNFAREKYQAFSFSIPEEMNSEGLKDTYLTQFVQEFEERMKNQNIFSNFSITLEKVALPHVLL